MTKTAIIIGSTGLTGSLLLKILLSSNIYNQVISFVRKELKISHPKLIQHVIDFDNPDSYQDLVKGDDMFCCLGTTIKKAGSQKAFEKVDLEYPTLFAKAAAINGVKQFSIISSLGANPQSGNFYLKTKGRCEEALRVLAFKSTSIFRPSLLLGNRKEFRVGERLAEYVMRIFSILMVGPLKKYRAIKAKRVAFAMFQIAQSDSVGFHIYQSDEISDIYTEAKNETKLKI
ncbi:NAD(P)H-binding protein [Dysgonomonas sp. BGC7]|uniref:NAD(P)H-binding protein n=1 Tax=Dysgonomonas sp. BGC7 TaxID=1658008 RepID=UPI0006806F44|nr:NAD(P)H-binding protein [Dysgonomonas sp. BGC7]MBD8388993.1 NAD(P)H-binding protein [Dysgonomonas sp. BGC7]